MFAIMTTAAASPDAAVFSCTTTLPTLLSPYEPTRFHDDASPVCRQAHVVYALRNLT